jgi:hypothetical protein
MSLLTDHSLEEDIALIVHEAKETSFMLAPLGSWHFYLSIYLHKANIYCDRTHIYGLSKLVASK